MSGSLVNIDPALLSQDDKLDVIIAALIEAAEKQDEILEKLDNLNLTPEFESIERFN